ncbi:MAG: transcriptional repressor NrdR [Planctomycetaceae bacterium]|nr:transcriptional repressor NrdR [Planctomycetaceae bacterium]MBQ2822804.1 transcriptional repressor NrdR [Thermoguttaceae bacterium]
MKCPSCHQDNDRVIDSRACDDGFGIRRRRECQFCSRRFTTYERIERAVMKVVKRDGTREVFDRQKLKMGLEIACRKRPVNDEQIEEILTFVENEIENRYDSEVESQYLGEILKDKLFHLDQVAFVRFTSVYRQFNDVKDFVEVLKPMLTRKK